MTVTAAERVIDFYSPSFVFNSDVHIQGGLSPLSVTDRGESLLIFDHALVRRLGRSRGSRLGWDVGWVPE